MTLLLRAARFATLAHGDQRRKYSGLPYIMHPARVSSGALRLREGSEELAAAGYLHDVIEDTGHPYEELRDLFGPYVAGIVRELTQPPKSVGNRNARKEMYHAMLRAGSREARLLKLLDRIDNLREMGPDDFQRVYTKESRHLLEAIGFTDDDLAAELEGLILKNEETLRG